MCVCVCVCGGECGGVASCCPLGQAKCHFSTLFTQQSKERPCLAAQPLSQHPSSANCQGSERQRPGKQVQAHGLQVLRSTAFDVPGLAPAPPQVPLCLPWVPPSGPAPLPHSCPHKGHCQARFLAGEVDSVRWDPFFPSQAAWLREPGGGTCYYFTLEGTPPSYSEVGPLPPTQGGETLSCGGSPLLHTGPLLQQLRCEAWVTTPHGLQ